MREEPFGPPTRPRGRARALTAALVLLAATQVGGCWTTCFKDDSAPHEPTDASWEIVVANYDAAINALDRQPEPDCRRARIAATIAATEHATWPVKDYKDWHLKLNALRDAITRTCQASGASPTPSPVAPSSPAPAPAPTGTSTRSTPTGTSTAPAPTPTVETAPPVVPSPEQEVPPAEPEPGSSGAVPVE